MTKEDQRSGQKYLILPTRLEARRSAGTETTSKPHKVQVWSDREVNGILVLELAEPGTRMWQVVLYCEVVGVVIEIQRLNLHYPGPTCGLNTEIF